MMDHSAFNISAQRLFHLTSTYSRHYKATGIPTPPRCALPCYGAACLPPPPLGILLLSLLSTTMKGGPHMGSYLALFAW